MYPGTRVLLVPTVPPITGFMEPTGTLWLREPSEFLLAAQPLPIGELLERRLAWPYERMTFPGPYPTVFSVVDSTWRCWACSLSPI